MDDVGGGLMGEMREESRRGGRTCEVLGSGTGANVLGIEAMKVCQQYRTCSSSSSLFTIDEE
ncbi:hypothetical protein E2562_012864 [Oryza meyeriana var. granulata]|uniref:Uncharacterized protein n=1 Tax=Oryza meyeriana var. granulata TaxID=110450 RepID=A0A6G1CQI1_9ORYZ|nr:hypothetical protein E2562_012864 [Oryza meyeriana var. granulata]